MNATEQAQVDYTRADRSERLQALADRERSRFRADHRRVIGWERAARAAERTPVRLTDGRVIR